MSSTDQNSSEETGEGQTSEEQEGTPSEYVINIGVLPVSVSLRAPMPDGGGGRIAYSNHDVGFASVPMETPITFTLGDQASEEHAIKVMAAVLNVVARSVVMAFQKQTDRLVRHDPTRPSPPNDSL